MALVPDQKFSTFQDGGDLEVGDIIVGLRGGLNTKFNYQGGLPPGVVVPIANGGTGAATAAQARINLGLGSMAQQDASAVNISGGTAVLSNLGLNAGTISTSPVNSTDIVNKGYVDSIATGITVQAACYAGTTSNLSGYTYNNGASGVGATLTAGSNGAFTTDGVSPALNARILVKNQSTAAQNGIYTLTTVGSVSTPAILTRATDYNLPSQINPGDLVVINAGTTLASSSWLETATVNTIGTDAITFVQFTTALPVGVPFGGTGLTAVAANQLLVGSGTNTYSLLSSTASRILTTDVSGVLGWRNVLPNFSMDTLSWSDTTHGILGTTTNNNAAAGYVGETYIVEVDFAHRVSLTSTVTANIANLTVPSGDFDIWGYVQFGMSAGASSVNGGISSTSAVLPDSAFISNSNLNGSTTLLYWGGNVIMPYTPLNAPTTIYLTANATFTGLAAAWGYLIARRRR